jgi:hypothetical protein
MLQAMPQPAPTPPNSGSQSFAGLLAAFASPGQKKPPARELGRDGSRDQARDFDGLADDVATLSYERALRAHARYHAPEEALAFAPQSLPMTLASAAPPSHDLVSEQPAVGEPLRIFEASPAQAEVRPAAAVPVAAAQDETIPAAHFALDAAPESATDRDKPFGLDRNLKSASITIRLSQAECVQLRRRAAEAGLTVSAYLRSCTFETEALRALVKDTLAKMRNDGTRTEGARTEGAHTEGAHTGGPKDAPSAPQRRRHRWRELLARFWPYARVNQREAQA